MARTLVLLAALTLTACGPEKAKPAKPAAPAKAKVPDKLTTAPADLPRPGQLSLDVSGDFSLALDVARDPCDAFGEDELTVNSDEFAPEQPPRWQFLFRKKDGLRLWTGPDDAHTVYTATGADLVTWQDGVGSFDAELVSEDGKKKVKVKGVATCTHLPTAPVPDDVKAYVKARTKQAVRDYSTYDFGRSKYEGAISVVVDQADARPLIADLREGLPLSWGVYYGTSRWLGDEKHDGAVEVIVAPVATQLDILRIARSNAVNYGKGTDSLIAQLAKWDAKYGIDIFHAETDTIEFTLRNEPKDLAAFAQELYEFCPDIVDQGVGSVKALEKQLETSLDVYLWWD